MTFSLKRTLCVLSFSFFVVLLCALGLFCDRKEYPHKMLPSSARHVNDYNWQSSFPPDYCYFLKAEIPEHDFSAYTDRMGFAKYQGDTAQIDWSGFGDVGQWWNPSDSSDIIYHDPTMRGSGKAMMKYENGFLYYKESSGI